MVAGKNPSTLPFWPVSEDEVAGNSSEESMDEEPPPEHAVTWQNDTNLPVGPPQMVAKSKGMSL